MITPEGRTGGGRSGAGIALVGARGDRPKAVPALLPRARLLWGAGEEPRLPYLMHRALDGCTGDRMPEESGPGLPRSLIHRPVAFDPDRPLAWACPGWTGEKMQIA